VHIGHIDIQDDYSYVDLPAGMPSDIFHDLKKVRVCGHAMKISKLNQEPESAAKSARPDRRPAKATAVVGSEVVGAEVEASPVVPALTLEAIEDSQPPVDTPTESEISTPARKPRATPPTEGPDIPVKRKSKVVRKSNAATKAKPEKTTKPSRKTRKDAKKD
jgi:hypothetical protein